MTARLAVEECVPDRRDDALGTLAYYLTHGGEWGDAQEARDALEQLVGPR